MEDIKTQPTVPKLNGLIWRLMVLNCNFKLEHWMVWMRTAALPTFRKLWGRIMQDLPAGKYRSTIENSSIIL